MHYLTQKSLVLTILFKNKIVILLIFINFFHSTKISLNFTQNISHKYQ